MQTKRRDMAAHLEHDDRDREHKPDPEASRHIDELRIGTAFRRHLDRLERHAANRAASRSHLPDLGMHRAGVDRALWPLRRFRGGRQVVCRISPEFFPAAIRAEMEHTPFMLNATR